MKGHQKFQFLTKSLNVYSLCWHAVYLYLVLIEYITDIFAHILTITIGDATIVQDGSTNIEVHFPAGITSANPITITMSLDSPSGLSSLAGAPVIAQQVVTLWQQLWLF